MLKHSRSISPETLESLASKWSVRDKYNELTNSDVKRSRADVLQTMFDEWRVVFPEASLRALEASLIGDGFYIEASNHNFYH